MDVEQAYEDYKKHTKDPTLQGFHTYLFGWITSRLNETHDLPQTHDPTTPNNARYTFMRSLGKGAMGEVVLVKDTNLCRPVAMKTMVLPDDQDNTWRQQFLSEVQITAQLDHPNIVPVYNAETHPHQDGHPSYTMKWIEGRTLRTLIHELSEDIERNKPLPNLYSLENRLDMFLNACDALAFAHSKGVLHRDLKPDNIMIGRYNQLYITDWGVSTTFQDPNIVTGATVEHTQTLWNPNHTSSFDAAVGTPAYMSPEQASNSPNLDGRSDIYTMGLILFELVSLRRANPPGPVLVVLARAANAVKQPLIHLDPKTRIPRHLRAIIARATAPHPRDRYASVEALAHDVRSYLRHDPIQAAPDTALEQLGRWFTRHKKRALTLISTTLIALTAAIIALLLLNIQTAQRAAQRQALHEHLLRAVSQQNHTIDRNIFRLHTTLTAITSRAGEATALPSPPDDFKLFTSKDFDQNIPPDLSPAKHTRVPTSTQHPVLVPAPGISWEDAKTRAYWMNSVTPALRDAFIRAVGQNPSDVNEAKTRALILSEDSLIFSIFLHMDGVHLEYPGRGGYPPQYDGRLRPWYTVGYNTDEIRCANPYRGAILGNFVLPCCTSIFSTEHKLYGVGCLELQFRWLQDHALTIPKETLPKPLHDTLTTAALVDAQGHILVDRDLTNETREANTAPTRFEFAHDTSAHTPLVPWPSVRNAIQQGQHGVQRIRDTTGDWLVAYSPLLSIEASYVLVLKTPKSYP